MPNTLTDAPIASNTLAFDQPRMEANNLYYLNTLSKDHQLALNTTDAVTFAGRHTQVSLNNRSNANLAMPGDGTDSLVWSSTGNLFWKNTTVSAGVQMTNSNAGTPVSAASGFTWLPGGIVMQWGTNTCASGTTITFPISFSAPPYSIQCTIFQNTTNRHFAYARSSTATNFVTTQLDSGGSGETNTFTWVAIGPK